jgi:hypothetical protein
MAVAERVAVLVHDDLAPHEPEHWIRVRVPAAPGEENPAATRSGARQRIARIAQPPGGVNAGLVNIPIFLRDL